MYIIFSTYSLIIGKAFPITTEIVSIKLNGVSLGVGATTMVSTDSTDYALQMKTHLEAIFPGTTFIVNSSFENVSGTDFLINTSISSSSNLEFLFDEIQFNFNTESNKIKFTQVRQPEVDEYYCVASLNLLTSANYPFNITVTEHTFNGVVDATPSATTNIDSPLVLISFLNSYLYGILPVTSYYYFDNNSTYVETSPGVWGWSPMENLSLSAMVYSDLHRLNQIKILIDDGSDINLLYDLDYTCAGTPPTCSDDIVRPCISADYIAASILFTQTELLDSASKNFNKIKSRNKCTCCFSKELKKSIAYDMAINYSIK
jgi:hypothetical protein